MIYNDLDYYEHALQLSVRSLAIFRELQDRRREAIVLYEIGNNALRLGRWQVAEENFKQAINLCENFAMHGRLGNLYWAQGLLYHFLGDELRSEAAYVRALAITQSPEHGDQRVANDVLWQLGFLYITQGHWDQGLKMYDQAILLARDLRRTHWLSLMHYQRGNVFERQGRIDDALAAYAEAIDGIELLRDASEDEEVKIGLLGATQQMQIYEAIVLLCLELGRPADAFHYVERARSRAFLDTLVKKSPELYAALAQPVVTLADVQAQLPAGALLLEYFTTGVLPSGEHMLNSIPESNARLREHLTLPPQVILFAITRDRCEVYRPALNPNSLRPPVGDRYPGRHLLHGRLPQHLYDKLIAPAAELLVDCNMLYLVPHGPLHYVPFTALRSAAGEYLLHSNGPALAHAPSATILLRNCIGRPPAGGTAALAIGFNDPQSDQPLRYAEAEAQHVARILGGDAWIGTDPKSERLIAAGRDIRWLHIAGHARFNPTDPLGSELYLGSGDALSARAIMRDLDLAADLVTLSSCTSGVSHVVPGDELLGLQRALLYAGAPTVLCTRWEARDLVSLLVMDLFYTALQQGRPAGLALRDAQIAVRELTGAELAALIERWNAPADLTPDDQSLTRELANIDLGAIRNMWRGEAPDLVAALDQPAIQPNTRESRPFADPLFWAPFMLVGRA
ncbi:MAG: CHAT domain-containing protein [Chloroflexota bacterium]|nr:CHAT domain-containing protein [Chloroflexota bacterium]